METSRRLISSLLLAAGLVLVFTGFSHALGFSAPAMVASVAVIAALLYAGGAWFGGAPAVPLPAGAGSLTVFDRDLQVVAGAATGARVTHRFPAAVRPEIEACCRAALRGENVSFTWEIDGRMVAFEAAPIAAASGQVLYGVLVVGMGPAIPSLSAATTAAAS
jgi:hypothetical protein